MINFAIKYSNKTMKIERKYLKLAQTNSIIMSILNMTILSILKNNIVGLTAWIILGYGLVVYLSWLPAYYISYKLVGGIKIRLKISIFYGEKVVHLADF